MGTMTSMGKGGGGSEEVKVEPAVDQPCLTDTCQELMEHRT